MLWAVGLLFTRVLRNITTYPRLTAGDTFFTSFARTFSYSDFTWEREWRIRCDLAVVIDSIGHPGTKGSAERFKEAIQPMDKASEAILGLKPVTFRYKHELDPEGIPQFGLVAEQVEKVDPDLVARDAAGKPYTVRYEEVNAMLLNEFLKEHRKVEQQGATIAKQQKQIEALTTGLQKVSDQLEVSKPAPKMVVNNQ